MSVSSFSINVKLRKQGSCLFFFMVGDNCSLDSNPTRQEQVWCKGLEHPSLQIILHLNPSRTNKQIYTHSHTSTNIK